MTIAKRFYSVLFAFALCAAMSLGSLSFMPKVFASSDFDYYYSASDPLPSSQYPYQYYLILKYSSGYKLVNIISDWQLSSVIYGTRSNGKTDLVFQPIVPSSGYHLQFLYTNRASSIADVLNLPTINSGNFTRGGITIDGSVVQGNYAGGFTNEELVAISPGLSVTGSLSGSFPTVGYGTPPDPSAPRFFGYSPFFFPEMPHGFFDGNINVVDGQYSIDLGSVTGTISNTGDTTTFEHYTFSVPQVVSDFDMVHQSQYTTYDGTFTSPSFTVSGQTTNTVHYVETGSVDINGSAPVSYVPSYNENSRFRCWSCVMDSSYVWFVSDTRNIITGSIVSVTSDEVSWKYEFSDPEGGNTIYPTWAIVFSPMGEVIQVLSPQTVSNKNTYTLSCSIGTLEQDQDTGIWSCDPLYHGFWFSNDSPPVANITHLNVAENKKYLANPVFGESAFQLNFLDSINRGIADINTNLQSLQSSLTSSISNQTSAFQNMDATPSEQPDTSNLMDYFAASSVYEAPDTSGMFESGLNDAPYWSGVTWWKDRFQELFVGDLPVQQILIAFTTATMTLGLAVMIIGRKVQF